MSAPAAGPGGFGRLVGETFRNPAAVARELLDMRLGRNVLWPGIALVAILNALIAGLPSGGNIQPFAEGIAIRPFTFAIIVGAALTIFVFALAYGGRAFNGQGDFTGALTVVLWTEVISVVLGAAQLVIGLVLTPLLAFTAIAALILQFWIMLHFINELHRFGSLMKSFLLVVGLGIAILIGATIMFTAIELLMGTRP
ncbi:Yip1 family protein [Pseudoroseicyclus tamaricis]|uniref:YIP1 family protein n=1 Tax=Pseudoroseicyclus tamaricis TaxID=2705421 RepID=A0A6B2JSK4_9RHOB|nr:Yip1 family protein [Pseudoroseicyclus tamaricis]NDV00980.1 YIP1 family protein [Pseudoroseicyclus tamaricis]